MPIPGRIYFIINKESGLAYDLSPENPENKRTVIGLPFSGEDSQKWKFLRTSHYWTIRNVSNGRFKDVDEPNAIRVGMRIVTGDEMEWDVLPDEHFDGWRLFIPQTPLNTALTPNVTGNPVSLQGEEPVRDQVWELKKVD